MANDDMAVPSPRGGRGKKIDYENAINIAPSLNIATQQGIAKKVCRTANLDWDSSKMFREKREKWLKLFLGVLPEKTSSYQNIANIHMPLIARSVLLLHARLYSQQFPVAGDIYNAYPTSPDDIDRARRVTKHMNFQLRREIVEYVPAHDRGMMQMLLYGSAFSVWDYDPVAQRPVFEFLRVDDVILPYKTLSDRVDMADLPRITRRRFRYRAALRRLHEQGIYSELPELADYVDSSGDWKSSNYDTSDDTIEGGSNITQLMDEVQGIEQSAEDPNAPRVLLEQDTFLGLPGEPEERPVTIVVDLATETLLHVSLREKEEPSDRARYEREAAEFEEQFQSQQMLHEQSLQAWQMTAEDVQASGQDIQSLPPPEPPPELPPPPRNVRKVPFNRYTHYRCMPNPEGVYGLGMAILLEGDNVAADAWVSAITSLATLNCLPTFVYSRQAASTRGDIPMKLGEGVESTLPPEQISKAFHQFQFPAPDPSAFRLLEMFKTNAEQLGAPEIFSGEVSDRETATTTEIRAEMAMQTIKTIAQRYNLARTNDVRVVAYINSQTLDDRKYFYVVDAGNLEMEEVGREDYFEDFDVGFTADLTFSKTMQSRQARQVIELLSQVPPDALMLSPEDTSLMWRTAVATSMRAIGADKEASVVENAAPPPPPPPPMPPGGPNEGPPPPPPPGADIGAPPIPPAAGAELGGLPAGPPPELPGVAGGGIPPGPFA